LDKNTIIDIVPVFRGDHYLWNKRFWELKSSSSISGADKRLQYAIKQIQDNPGGVILNILGDVDMNVVEEQLTKRIFRSNIGNMDLMLLSNSELFKILKYKKCESRHASSHGVCEHTYVLAQPTNHIYYITLFSPCQGGFEKMSG